MWLQVRVTKDGQEKIMNVKVTGKWLEVDDPNKNGYYKVKGVGKVKLIQLLGDQAGLEPFTIEVEDSDILTMWMKEWTNSVLRLDGGGIAYALCEVLQAVE